MTSKPRSPQSLPPQTPRPNTVHVTVTVSSKPSLLRGWKRVTGRLRLSRSSLEWGLIWIIGLIGATVILTHHAIAQITTQTSLNQVHTALSTASQQFRPAAPLPLVRSIAATALPADLEEPPNFGHLPYPEVSPAQLIPVGSYSQGTEQRFEYLTHEAGLALMKMLDAARADGVWIVPVSAFRDVERQDLLFKLQVQRSGSRQAAARAVAPPGYSEHHTGLAVDLADGLARARDVSISFGQTAAFQWLTQHAQAFGYELSFPADNPQGVNYEPWHWRFVGSPDASQIFALAR